MLSLTISDTGRGFDPATIGTGLTNMTDRLSAIGGQLAINTAPGRGTRINARPIGEMAGDIDRWCCHGLLTTPRGP